MLSLGKRSTVIMSAMLGLAIIAFTLLPLHPRPTDNAAAVQDSGVQTYVIPHCLQPPASVDLSTLTDGELAQYGLPPRPTNAAMQSAWTQAMQHAKHRSCEYQIRSLQQRGIPHTSEWDNNHWAGNMAYGGGYSQASANWYMHCPSGGSNAYASAWAGLGAYPQGSSDNIIQSGTDGWGDGSTYAWIENYSPSNDSSAFATWHPGCNDWLYSDNGINNGYASMYIEDETTGNWLSSQYTTVNTNPGNASKSAEWIIEGKCCGYDLANFGTWYLDNDYYVRNGSGKYVGNSTHDYAVMCNGGVGNPCWWPGVENANPGGIVGGTYFPVYWDHA